MWSNDREVTALMDAPWQAIEGLTFYPWKGEKYGTPGSAFGTRILLMGESTYCSKPENECPKELYLRQRAHIGPGWFAHYGVYAYRQGKWNDAFWTKLITVLLNREIESLADRRLVLDSVAFWNYGDPEPLEAHSIKVPEKDRTQANVKLRNVIRELKPQLVILLSKRLWDNLGEGSRAFENCHPNAQTGTLCRQEVDEGEIRFLCLPHTRGFKYADVKPAVRKAIECAGKQTPAPIQGAPVSRWSKRTVYQITLYKRYGAWFFDDDRMGFHRQPLVHGITEMAEHFVRSISGSSDTLEFSFSGKQEPVGFHAVLRLLPELLPGRHRGMRKYQMEGTDLRAWICGDLNRYFTTPPERIYCSVVEGPAARP